MKKNAIALPFAVGAFLLLAACGDDVTKTTVVETGISQLAKGAEFPECSTETNGETLYAADLGKAYICTGKAWTPLHGESSADTVVVRDTLVQKDSIVIKDTVVLKDSLISKDTLVLSNVDTVVISNVDTLVIRDTLLGLNGESCSAETLEDSRGYKIVCGGDSVGVVLNGINGEKGDDGESCTVADSGNGVVAVQCESDTVKLYKALCANEPYDPSVKFCSDGELYSCDGKPYDPSVKFCSDGELYSCDGKPYDPAESFCYNGGAKDTIVTLCGGSIYDVTTQYCSNGTVATYGKLADLRDNQTYKTVVIGSLTWMAQNLNYDYNEGSAQSYCYGNSADSCAKYGRLYTWSAAMDSAAVFSTDGSGCGNSVTCSATEPVRGVCPAGWHLPTEAEWEALFTAVGGQSSAGTKLKATSGWGYDYEIGKYGNGTDDYGFSALAAGAKYTERFDDVGKVTFFWSASEVNGEYGGDVALWSFYVSATFDINGGLLKKTAASVRCVKDAD